MVDLVALLSEELFGLILGAGASLGLLAVLPDLHGVRYHVGLLAEGEEGFLEAEGGVDWGREVGGLVHVGGLFLLCDGDFCCCVCLCVCWRGRELVVCVGVVVWWGWVEEV